MQIVIIGTGNTATVLAKKLYAAGHRIVQVCGRNATATGILAELVGAESTTQVTALTQDAALYILAVADKALYELAAVLRLGDRLVVHTAGAVSKEILRPVSAQYGVFYPYQTIRKEIEPIPPMPVMVDASNEEALQVLRTLAGSITSQVSVAGDLARMQYHVCAVMTNNFSNYLYALTSDYCIKNGLDFNNLLPLLDETTRRLHQHSPQEVQTGPAIRKDIGTMQQHLDLLEEEPAMQKIYEILSDGIMRYPW
jgi:predicted short-subunit dehydrogenase-like oxidoreductase (DUF2520 family)